MLLLLAALGATAPDAGQPGPADAGTASVADGGTAEAVGSLDKAVIREGILSNQSRIRACDESALTEARAQGKVSVRFVLSPSGDVGSAEVVADTTKRSSLAACVAAQVVTYPFFFPASPDAGPSPQRPAGTQGRRLSGQQ